MATSLSLALTVLVTTGLPAPAAIEVSQSKIYISGDIMGPDLEAFFHAVNPVPSGNQVKPKEIRLVLNSSGGDLQTAFYMARIIEKARGFGTNISAYVPVGAECNSACIVVFAAAQQRLAAPDARFMVHGLTYIGRSDSNAVKVQRLVFTESYHQQIRRADPKFASFIRKHRLIEDDLEMTFTGKVLFRAFDDFITALTPLEAS